jgi:hypothetical protein
MARYSIPAHDLKPALAGWSAFVGMGRNSAAAALITNQPRGY